MVNFRLRGNAFKFYQNIVQVLRLNFSSSRVGRRSLYFSVKIAKRRNSCSKRDRLDALLTIVSFC